MPTIGKGFGVPTNLDTARFKWGRNIVDHERRQAITRNIPKLLRLTHVQSADVNGVQLSIIAEGHRGNLWANAQAVYAAITGEAIARYEELEDECQIAEVIDDCTEGLAICLDTQRDLPEEERLSDASREELLSALFEIWKFGQDYGGVDTDVVDTIASNVTNDERKMVEGWLQSERDEVSEVLNAPLGIKTFSRIVDMHR